MDGIINNYVKKMTIIDIDGFARKQGIIFNEKELNFVMEFIKKNWQELLHNPDSLVLERYQNYFTEENYKKLEKVIKEYRQRYKKSL